MTGEAFERAFEPFLREQMKKAKGQRLAKLQGDLTGTKIMLQAVIWPVFRSFDDLELEYPVRTRMGSRIYVDVFHKKLRIAFEEEFYVTHAEKVTRDRFDFERFRARTSAARKMIYFPYSRDELQRRPDLCRRDLYELVGMLGSMEGSGLMEVPLREREVIRCAVMKAGPFRIADVTRWLALDRRTCKKVLDGLETKGLIRRAGGSEFRIHAYELEEQAYLLLGM